MTKSAKTWLAIAVSLILIGCIIFGGVMAMLKWDFTKLSTDKYETNKYDVTEEYTNISVVTKTADIAFVISENSKCSVECYEQEKVRHSVTVRDGALVIDVVDSRKWYEHIGINFGAPKITVYIPAGEYGALSVKSNTGAVQIAKELSFASIDVSESTGDVTSYASSSGGIKIKTSTGNIYVEGISAGSLELSASTGNVTVSGVACRGDATVMVTTGKVTASGVRCDGDVSVDVSTGKAYLTDITCKSLISDGDTGSILLTNVIAAERLSIERSTGDVTFDGCDAAKLSVETDTGDVRGSLLTDKVFTVSTDTGKIDVPQTASGGRCEISTDTGDINITIK